MLTHCLVGEEKCYAEVKKIGALNEKEPWFDLILLNCFLAWALFPH